MAKMGARAFDDVSEVHLSQLRSNLNMRTNDWWAANERKRTNYIAGESFKGGLFAVIGGVLGGLLGGPPGAILGAAIGGGGSAARSKIHSDDFDDNTYCGDFSR